MKATDKETFLSDPDKIGSAKYHFIVAVESAIDITNHVISQNGYRTPEDYGDAFQVLGEHGVFTRDFVIVLKTMAKLRNRLTYLYWEVDDEQVYSILQERLGDFKTFLGCIAEFLGLKQV